MKNHVGGRFVVLLMACLILGCGCAMAQRKTPAQKAANAKKAKELFESTYQKVYGLVTELVTNLHLKLQQLLES